MKQSKLEASFTTQYLQVGRHSLLPEHIFDEPEDGRKKRMWRFDFANPESKVGVELDGGEFSSGRHVRPQGFIDDCEKMNAATMQGWSVLRFPGSVFKDDPAGCIDMVDSLIDVRLPDTEAKEGADASTTEPEHEARTEPITVAVSEPSITAADVAAVVEAEPVEAPEPVAEPAPVLKLLPQPETHFDVGQFVYIKGQSTQSYEIMEVRKHYALRTVTNNRAAWLWKKAEHITLFPWYEKKELKEASGQ